MHSTERMPTHPALNRWKVTFCALALASGVAGCHSEEPKSPDVGLTKAVVPPKSPELGRGAARVSADSFYHVRLGQSLVDVCRGPSPFFDFDSSETGAEDQPTMQTLATCMVNGPLQGKSIRLIGHTDPRGSESYNVKLGRERAERVRRYLVAHGVDINRVLIESAGKTEASDEPTEWPRDRRVEIQIAP